MMIVKLELRSMLSLLLLAVLAIQGCAPAPSEGTVDFPASSSTPDEVPTWTPRSVDLTRAALPSATRPFDQTQDKPALIVGATRIPQTPTVTPEIMDTPKVVSVRIDGGNLSVRRGPSVDYNYVGVLKEGDVVIANGRDRISRWIRIALPSAPDVEGWITSETDYTLIDGDISNLPYIEAEPARPAYIRNCTKYEMWIMPAEVSLLSKFDEPYNEERFPVGVYQVYDVENLSDASIEQIDLSEGETVEIRYDGLGEKSKCEE
jgi:hypothetical protein